MIKLLAVGTMKDKHLQSIQNDYLKRISHKMKIELIEIRESKIKTPDIEKIKNEEADNIMKVIKSDDWVILLDLEGNMIDSLQLANNLERWSQKDIIFVIGGSWGVSDTIKKRANFRWQLSRLTFPHLLARVMVLEQIYRGFKILSNETYHK